MAPLAVPTQEVASITEALGSLDLRPLLHVVDWHDPAAERKQKWRLRPQVCESRFCFILRTCCKFVGLHKSQPHQWVEVEDKDSSKVLSHKNRGGGGGAGKSRGRGGYSGDRGGKDKESLGVSAAGGGKISKTCNKGFHRCGRPHFVHSCP